MRKFLISTLAAAAATATIASTGAYADAAEDTAKARRAFYTLVGFEMGTLGAMAKGAMDYDADKAAGAASNLYALVTMDQSAVWPAGSDNGAVDTTRALPAIWNDFPGVMAASKAMVEAAATMKDAAGTDLASLQGAIGAVGGACGGCHKAYRAPAN